MTITVVCAGKTSPGATCTALALALGWPRPLLLVDADPAGGDVVPGFLPGRVDAEQSGVLAWLVASRRASAAEAARLLPQFAVAIPEAGDLWLLPGPVTPAQGAALAGGWERISQGLEEFTRGGRDVLVDAGRLGDTSCWPLLARADRVLLVVRPTARSVQATVHTAALLRDRLGDLDRVALVVAGAGPYSSTEVATGLGFPSAQRLPADPRAAAGLVDGAGGGLRGVTRSRLVRAAGDLARTLTGATEGSASPRLTHPEAAERVQRVVGVDGFANVEAAT